MTKRKDDSTQAPPGGRAAERLREFERARGLEPEQLKKGKKPAVGSADEAPDAPVRDRPAPPGPKKK